MRRLLKMLPLLILTSWFFLSTSSLAAGANLPPISCRRIPPGWTTDESGYFFTEEQLTEFATAAFTYEAESAAWRKAYWELDQKYKRMLSDFDSRLDVISARHEETIAAYGKELSKARRREHLPGIGFFVGPVYNGSDVELGAGIGLVWKM